jgi:uncharacterized protein YbaR (Trm112 family)
MDARLLDILVCPICKANLEYRKASRNWCASPAGWLSRSATASRSCSRTRRARYPATRLSLTGSEPAAVTLPSRSSFPRVTRPPACRPSRCSISAASRWSCASPSAPAVGCRRGAGGHRPREVLAAAEQHGLRAADPAITQRHRSPGRGGRAARLERRDDRGQCPGRRAADRSGADRQHGRPTGGERCRHRHGGASGG